MPFKTCRQNVFFLKKNMTKCLFLEKFIEILTESVFNLNRINHLFEFEYLDYDL